MSSDHVKLLEEAIYNRLSGGTALTALLGGTLIYNQLAPPHQQPPYVIFSYQGGGDDNITQRRQRSVIYAIQAVTLAGRLPAANLDKEIDALVHGWAFTISGWGNWWTSRTGDISFVEEDDAGRAYFRQGGLYRIRMATT